MKTKQEIKEKIAEIEADELYSYPMATVSENAALALVQLEMETKVRILNWVLNEK